MWICPSVFPWAIYSFISWINESALNIGWFNQHISILLLLSNLFIYFLHKLPRGTGVPPVSHPLPLAGCWWRRGEGRESLPSPTPSPWPVADEGGGRDGSPSRLPPPPPGRLLMKEGGGTGVPPVSHPLPLAGCWWRRGEGRESLPSPTPSPWPVADEGGGRDGSPSRLPPPPPGRLLMKEGGGTGVPPFSLLLSVTC